MLCSDTVGYYWQFGVSWIGPRLFGEAEALTLSSLPPSSEEDERQREDRAGSWSWGCKKNPSDSLSLQRTTPSPLSSLSLWLRPTSLPPSIQLLYPPPDCTQHTQNLIFGGFRMLLGSGTLLDLDYLWLKSSSRGKENNLFFSNSAAEEGRSDLRIVRSIHPLPPHPQHPCTDLRRRAPRTGRRTHIKPV